MPFTPSNWSAVNSTADMLVLANNNAGGFFWSAMIYMLFGIMLITLTGSFGWEAGLLASAFFGLVLSIMGLYLGLVGIATIGTFVAMIILMIIYITWANKYD